MEVKGLAGGAASRSMGRIVDQHGIQQVSSDALGFIEHRADRTGLELDQR
jgi:hypothetical protein